MAKVRISVSLSKTDYLQLTKLSQSAGIPKSKLLARWIDRLSELPNKPNLHDEIVKYSFFLDSKIGMKLSTASLSHGVSVSSIVRGLIAIHWQNNGQVSEVQISAHTPTAVALPHLDLDWRMGELGKLGSMYDQAANISDPIQVSLIGIGLAELTKLDKAEQVANLIGDMKVTSSDAELQNLSLGFLIKALIRLKQNRLKDCRSFITSAQATSQNLRNRWLKGMILLTSAELERVSENYALAEQNLYSALEILDSQNHPMEIGMAYAVLINLSIFAQDKQRTEHFLKRLETIALKYPNSFVAHGFNSLTSCAAFYISKDRGASLSYVLKNLKSDSPNYGLVNKIWDMEMLMEIFLFTQELDKADETIRGLEGLESSIHNHVGYNIYHAAQGFIRSKDNYQGAIKQMEQQILLENSNFKPSSSKLFLYSAELINGGSTAQTLRGVQHLTKLKTEHSSPLIKSIAAQVLSTKRLAF